MDKFTPGPWVVGQINEKKQSVYIDAPHGDDRSGMTKWTGMAKCYGCDDDKEWGTETMLANARLIAAAPELLAALESVVRVADRATNEFIAARSAIAKARGQ